MPFHPDGSPYTIEELMKAAGAKAQAKRRGPIAEGCVTPYQFAKTVGVQPQMIYGLTKRDATFPSFHDENGRVVVPIAEALLWWANKFPPPTIVTEPVLAFRSFTLDTGYMRLGSYNHEFWWTVGGPTKAVCDFEKRSHEAPAKKCSCGLYALRTVEEVERQNYAGRGYVLAAVALWGHVISGHEEDDRERGYRAQYGQVICVLCNDWKIANDLHRVAQRYKAPVTHNKNLFTKTNWVEQWNSTIDLAATLGIEEGGISGHWREGEGDDSASLEAAFTGTGTAACRTAAARASSLEQLKYLLREGTISISNLEEFLELEGGDA